MKTGDIPQFFLDVKKMIDEDSSKALQDTDKFNIFNILDLERKEVKLHSRLLYALLNPNGMHNMGNVYLKLFLQELFQRHDMTDKQIKQPSLDNGNLDSMKISREKDNIDLLLQFKDGYTIIIENKIDAYDQPEQLKRYYDTIKSKYSRKSSKVIICYLTLYGYEPEEHSISGLKVNINLISYEVEILNWLEKCIENTKIANAPNIFYILKQYAKTVDYITNSIADEREFLMNEIAKYIGANKENFQTANDISDGLNYAKRNVLMKFMTVIKDEFNRVGYSEDDIYFGEYEISEYYTKTKNTGVPSIEVYKILTLDENLYLNFIIEVNYELCYYFAFGQYKKNKYIFIERKSIQKKYPSIYENVENAIWGDMEINNTRQRNKSIKWDYIYDEYGEKYDFKRFSNNCIELIENGRPIARKIAKKLLKMIDSINSSIDN